MARVITANRELQNIQDLIDRGLHLADPFYFGVPTSPVTSRCNAAYSDLVLCDPTGSGFTITLPPITASDIGRFVTVCNYTSSTNTIVVRCEDDDATISGQVADTFKVGYTRKTYLAVKTDLWVVMFGLLGCGDTIAPRLTINSPDRDEIVDGYVIINFDVTDSGDVQQDTIDAYVNDAWVIEDGVIDEPLWGGTITSITDGYRVNLLKATELPDGDYTVRVLAEDACENLLDNEWDFIIDDTPPYLENEFPDDGTTTTYDTAVYVNIKDDGVGVDQSTIDAYVNGVIAYTGSSFVSPYDGDDSDCYAISGGYHINIDTDLYFYSSEIRIVARDDGGTQMDDSWEFTVDPTELTEHVNSNSIAVAVQDRILCSISSGYDLNIYYRADDAYGPWILEETFESLWSSGTVGIDVDGDTIVCACTATPNIKVYVKSGGSWSLQQSFNASPSASYGPNVAIYGDRIFVGEEEYDSAPFTDIGRVHVYLRSGGTWSINTYVNSPSNNSYAHFGTGVDANSNGYLALGGFGCEDPNTNDGGISLAKPTVSVVDTEFGNISRGLGTNCAIDCRGGMWGAGACLYDDYGDAVFINGSDTYKYEGKFWMNGSALGDPHTCIKVSFPYFIVQWVPDGESVPTKMFIYEKDSPGNDWDSSFSLLKRYDIADLTQSRSNSGMDVWNTTLAYIADGNLYVTTFV